MPNISEILSISKKYNLKVIEDFSEAIFSKYKNIMTGKFGDVSVASLHATKTITTGEGGIVLTDNKKLFMKMKKIREHGFLDKKIPYSYNTVGSNYKMSNLLAAIGYAQIRKIKNIIKKKIKIINNYNLFLKNCEFFSFPIISKNEKPIMWSYPLIVKKKFREKLIKYLSSKKIEVRPCFKMIFDYNHLKINKNQQKNIDKNIILLPSHLLLNRTKIKYISDHIINFFKSNNKNN